MAIEVKKSDKSILNNVLYIRDKVIKDEFCIIQRAKIPFLEENLGSILKVIIRRY